MNIPKTDFQIIESLFLKRWIPFEIQDYPNIMYIKLTEDGSKIVGRTGCKQFYCFYKSWELI